MNIFAQTFIINFFLGILLYHSVQNSQRHIFLCKGYLKKYCNILPVKTSSISEDKSINVPSVTTTDFEPQKPEKGEKKPQIAETENYLDFVQQMTEKGELVQAKDLIYKLGLLNVDQKLIEKAILDQYKIAVQRKVRHIH